MVLASNGVKGNQQLMEAGRPVDFVFVGDLCLSGIYSEDSEVLKNTLKEFRRALSSDTILFFNLECSYLDSGIGADTQANADSLYALSELKPAVANLSNNHHFDTGPEGSHCIKEILKEIGVPAVGLYEAGRCTHDVVEIGSARVAVVARTASGTNPKSFGDSSSRILPIDEEEVISTCREIKGEYDQCIVCLHWGAEYYRRPSPRQRRLVDRLSEIGVDIIWGHHAHVLQPRKMIENTLVLFNMGNAVFGEIDKGRWPAVSSAAAMVGIELNNSKSSCWERRFVAGTRGEPLTVDAAAIEVPVKRHTAWPYSYSVLLWLFYRAYMEVIVFGWRYFARRLSRKDAAENHAEGVSGVGSARVGEPPSCLAST